MHEVNLGTLLFECFGPLDAVTDLRAAVDAHERAIIENALGRHRYNQRQTARALGLSYDQLRHAMRKHGLSERV